MKRKADKIIIVIFFVGAAVFFYPIASNVINSYYEKTAVTQYCGDVNEMKKEKINEEMQKAQEYNLKVMNSSNEDMLDENNQNQSVYRNLLNVNGVMGNIVIPKISLSLPIYHGTSEDVLSKGIGHMKGTSLPIGGKDTHAVLTGHRGLPSAKLFTDLDKIEKGDLFYIKVMDRTLTYKVDQVKVVEPYDSRDLMAVEGKDYVTLVTCTPYGINSHRLLVRGVRIIENKTVITEKADNRFLYIILAAFVGILVVVILIILRRKRLAKSIN